jgi:hypothetical protein
VEDINVPFSKLSWKSQIYPESFAICRKHNASRADTFQMRRMERFGREQNDFNIVAARQRAEQFCGVPHQSAHV